MNKSNAFLYGLYVFLCFFIAIVIKVNNIPVSNAKDVFDNNMESNAWNEIQEWRKESGRREYKLNAGLCTLAKRRSLEIQEDWSHHGFKAVANISEFNSNGENLARHFTEVDEMFVAWLGSPAHREILEKDYSYSCVKCSFDSKNMSYCVQLFGSSSTMY
jgi:uncharacterized protein YkwD